MGLHPGLVHESRKSSPSSRNGGIIGVMEASPPRKEFMKASDVVKEWIKEGKGERVSVFIRRRGQALAWPLRTEDEVPDGFEILIKVRNSKGE